ncbi:hypothetical protein ACFW95_20260 [Streptomyces sp. NPDC059474]|uniref:hypothetical protein n=1 Tax=Streptomyces sp. NPDC059474 TaxID=3346846 RepID=UPI0036C43F65
MNGAHPSGASARTALLRDGAAKAPIGGAAGAAAAEVDKAVSASIATRRSWGEAPVTPALLSAVLGSTDEQCTTVAVVVGDVTGHA